MNPLVLLFSWVVAVPVGLLIGWTASILWAWFIVPLGMMPISAAHGWGFAILANLFLYRSKVGKKNDGEKLSYGLVGWFVMEAVILCLFSLLFAYLAKEIML